MVAANLKSETKTLTDRRAALEAEMNAIIERLCQPSGPGISGNLVDSEGYPRSDIDVPRCHNSRRVSTYEEEDSRLVAMDLDVIVSIPFALVDKIADASPASEDGLQPGDQIVKFGIVESGENLLARLASEAQANQGHAIPVLVTQGAHANLAVTTRTWQDWGLLGAIFVFCDGFSNGERIMKLSSLLIRGSEIKTLVSLYLADETENSFLHLGS